MHICKYLIYIYKYYIHITNTYNYKYKITNICNFTSRGLWGSLHTSMQAVIQKEIRMKTQYRQTWSARLDQNSVVYSSYMFKHRKALGKGFHVALTTTKL